MNSFSLSFAARHVSTIFEKLGFDGSKGAEVFGLLCEALDKVKRQDPSEMGR